MLVDDEEDRDQPPPILEDEESTNPLARDLVFFLTGPAGIAAFFALWYLISGGDQAADFAPISLEDVFIRCSVRCIE